jgi:outer membrane protein TolC
MGRPPGDYPRDAEACDAPPSLDRLLPVGDGMALLRRRPDVRAAERTLAAATANIGVEAAQLYPQVSIGGSIGVGGPLSNLGSLSSVGGAVGPLLSWTFPNRAATRARVSEAGAEADQAAAEFDGAVIEALRQTETALSAYARELDRDRASERARADAALAADQAARLYRFGRTGLLDVLTAQAALANAEAALAQSRTALIDRQVDVFLSLGGGWQVASGGDKPG